MMFGQGVLAHRFITEADEGEEQKGIRDVTGRDALALMHWDVVKDVKGKVKSRLKCRLQEAGTSLDFQNDCLILLRDIIAVLT